MNDYYEYDRLGVDIEKMSRQLEDAIKRQHPQATINAYVTQLRDYLSDYLRRSHERLAAELE